MKQLNSNGGQNFMALLPTSRAYAHEASASVRDGLRGIMGMVPADAAAPAPAPADTEPSEAADTLARFRAALNSLEIELGRDVLSPADRAALEANPAERAAWLKTHDEAEARAKKDDLAAAKAAAADRVRRTSTATLLAFEARKARG